MSNRTFKVLFIIGAVLLYILIGWAIYQSRADTPSEGSSVRITTDLERVYLQDNTLVGISPPFYPKPLTYETLIDCLIRKESSGNEWEIGQAG